jgi:hypothetical protein
MPNNPKVAQPHHRERSRSVKEFRENYSLLPNDKQKQRRSSVPYKSRCAMTMTLISRCCSSLSNGGVDPSMLYQNLILISAELQVLCFYYYSSVIPLRLQ